VWWALQCLSSRIIAFERGKLEASQKFQLALLQNPIFVSCPRAFLDSRTKLTLISLIMIIDGFLFYQYVKPSINQHINMDKRINIVSLKISIFSTFEIPLVKEAKEAEEKAAKAAEAEAPEEQAVAQLH